MKKCDGAGWVTRNDLLRLLDRSHEYALTLLLAPAGSGKSTLLEQWRRRSAGTCILISLTAADADPVRFFRRLDQALRQQIHDYAGFSYNELSVEAEVPPELVTEALEQALDQIRTPLTIVLDDFQCASDSMIQQVLGGLMHRLPANVHFVMGSRSHPAFSLSRLKLEDQLLLIDGHDLRLSREEMVSFARRLLGRELAEQEANGLMALTEGWAAGVKLALLAGMGKAQVPLESFTGTRPELVDYFAYVVLHDLPSETQDFLLATSVLDALSAPLCDYILDSQHSLMLLEDVVARELFVQPHTSREGWYRYHPLFQEFLLHRLEATEPERLVELRKRAALWSYEASQFNVALEHASRSGDELFFLEMMRDCCGRWIKTGQFNLVLTWVQPMPEETVLSDWELLVPLTGALIFSRRFHQAGYYLDVLRNNKVKPAGDLGDMSMIPFLELMLKLFQHDSEFRITADLELLAQSGTHHDIRAFAVAMLAYHRLMHGDLRGASEYAEQAKAVLGQLGYAYLESYADLILILCFRFSGKMPEAISHTNEVFARYSDQESSQSWINAATAMAVTCYEQNRLDEARGLAERLTPLVSASCATEVVANAYITLARILHLDGQHRRSQRLLDDLERVLKLGGYERFLSQSGLERVRQAFSLNDLAAMDAIIGDFDLATRWQEDYLGAGAIYSEAWERQGLMVALWLRAHQRFDEAEQVLRVMQRVLEERGMNLHAVIATANLAVIRMQRGDRMEAMSLLRDKLQYSGLACFSRMLFDEAPGAGQWLSMAVEQGLLSLPDFYTDMFGALLDQDEAVAESRDKAPTREPLTPREEQILKLLREGLNNEQISQVANVALSTTKWHLKNIYAKLGVANRTEAVIRSSA